MLSQLKKINIIGITFYFLIIIMISLAFFIGQYTLHLNAQNYHLLNSQTDALTNLLTDQIEKEVAPLVYQKNQKALNQVTDNLQKNPLINNATIYDKNGVTLADNATSPLKEEVGLMTPLGTKSYGKQQLVSEILYENTLVGFVRISLNRNKVVQQTQSLLKKNDNRMRLMLVSCILLGLLLGFLITKKYRF